MEMWRVEQPLLIIIINTDHTISILHHIHHTENRCGLTPTNNGQEEDCFLTDLAIIIIINIFSERTGKSPTPIEEDIAVAYIDTRRTRNSHLTY